MSVQQDLLNNFIIKYEEALKALDVQCMMLESNPTDKNLIDITFRVVHTIKGDSGFFGLTAIKQVAHAMEDVLSLIRSDKKVVDGQIIDFLWGGVSLLGMHLSELKTTGTCKEPSQQHEMYVRAFKDQCHDTEQEVVEKLIEKEKDEVAYWFSGKDLTNEMLLVFSFVDKLRSSQENLDEVETFVTVLERILEKLDSFQDKKLYSLVLHLRNDFDMLVGDDGSVNDFLRQRVIEEYSPIRRLLDVVPKKAVESVSEEVRNVFSCVHEVETTFRIEEEKIDELYVAFNRFDEVEQELRKMQVMCIEHNAAPELTTKLQTVINRFIYINQDVFQMLTKLKLVSPDLFLDKNQRLIEALALSCGKKVKVITESQNRYVERSMLEVLERIFLHVVRNCIDHGIERPEERLLAGKPEEGTISLRMYEDESNLNVIIEDDGQGIDFSRVRQKAFDRGLIGETELETLTDSESVELLFKPGFTTTNEVTDISGRGVGLDVVYREVVDTGGAMEVLSEVGKGSIFKLYLPRSKEHF